MTRRERAIARLARRREWAAGRQQKATACFAQGDPYRGDVAFNTQPGHIPERARVIRAQERGFEHSQMADHHAGKAAGIEAQLENTIFSDDENAVEALRAKIADQRATVEKMKAANKIIRKFKADIPGGVAALTAAGFSERTAKLFEPDFAGRIGFPGFELTNTGANIRRMEARIVDIQQRQQRQEKAEAAPGGILIEGTGDYVRVTFPEKPERDILDALRAAGFRWGGGSWTGQRANLPAAVQTAKGTLESAVMATLAM